MKSDVVIMEGFYKKQCFEMPFKRSEVGGQMQLHWQLDWKLPQ